MDISTFAPIRARRPNLTLLFIVVLVLITVFLHFKLMQTSPERRYERHLAVVEGTHVAPARYRVLSEYVVYAVTETTGISFETASVLARLAQNTAILALAYLYYRSFCFTTTKRYLGVALLALGLIGSYHNNGTELHTYTELALFLAAAVAFSRGSFFWVLPLAVAGMLNREGAVFIPVLLIASHRQNRRAIAAGTTALVIAVAIYFGLRAVLGDAPYSESRYGKVYPGPELVYLNLINVRTWFNLLPVYHVLPLSLLWLRRWPPLLRSQLVALAIPWIALVFWYGSTDETRLFLVPLALVLIPAGLSLLAHHHVTPVAPTDALPLSIRSPSASIR